MARYRYRRPFRKATMNFSGHRKPRNQQWFTGKKPGARFTCGLCHHKYTRRDNLNRHKRQCYANEARLNGMVKECHVWNGINPR